MHEGRSSNRRLTLRTGKISAIEAATDIDCAVLNVSRTGACVLVPAGVQIPERFELAVDREDVTRNCRRIWRDGSRIGVEFLAVAALKKS